MGPRNHQQPAGDGFRLTMDPAGEPDQRERAAADDRSIGPLPGPGVLELRLKETPQPNYAVPVPAEISGRVLLRQPGTSAGAEGVSVTDGYSVARTNVQGEYTLIPYAQAVFIFVTRPANLTWRATGTNPWRQWWISRSGQRPKMRTSTRSCMSRTPIVGRTTLVLC